MEMETQDSFLQTGFAVSTRHFKHAVDRNRIKRLMRESYRLQKNNLANELVIHNKKLAVFFIYTAAELPKYNEVYEKTGTALVRIKKSIIEN